MCEEVNYTQSSPSVRDGTLPGRSDTHHNDAQHKWLIFDTQHNADIMLSVVMLSAAFYLLFLLNFVMLNVVMLSVVGNESVVD